MRERPPAGAGTDGSSRCPQTCTTTVRTVSDGADLRDEFLLDPGVTFLNHGSFGACPRGVFERYQEWQLKLERQPVLFLARRLEELLAEARAAVGAYVGADPEDLVFVPNATAGVNIAARALGLQPGDEVLSTDLEYGALDLTWERVCAEFGARYLRTPIRLPVTSHDEIVETLWSAVGPRTRVLFVSQHTSTTALTLPVAELCRRAREAGIRTVIDGAHVPGCGRRPAGEPHRRGPARKARSRRCRQACPQPLCRRVPRYLPAESPATLDRARPSGSRCSRRGRPGPSLE